MSFKRNFISRPYEITGFSKTRTEHNRKLCSTEYPLPKKEKKRQKNTEEKERIPEAAIDLVSVMFTKRQTRFKTFPPHSLPFAPSPLVPSSLGPSFPPFLQPLTAPLTPPPTREEKKKKSGKMGMCDGGRIGEHGGRFTGRLKTAGAGLYAPLAAPHS